MDSPAQALQLLQHDSLFRDWNKQRKADLTHFFCSLDAQAQLLSPWEIGFVEHQKITVFTFFQDKVIIKPADDIFKREEDVVEKLDFAKATVSWEEARTKCLRELPTLYPTENRGNGFCILQSWKGTIVWNFTFITKSIKFLNLKLNAGTGTVHEHQLLNLTEK